MSEPVKAKPVSADAELELLLDLLDDSERPRAIGRLRELYLPIVKAFLRKVWAPMAKSEIDRHADWILDSFVEGVIKGAINGDESFAIVLIRLAKTGIREYNKASDEIADTSTAPYRSADLWFNWTLLQADGRASEFKRAIRDQLSSRSELHLQVLQVMCETGGRISDNELVDRVRFSMGHRTTAEILNARNELRQAVCTKITELRRPSK